MPAVRDRKSTRCAAVRCKPRSNLVNERRPGRWLLADAERREDLAEQVVARELARELAQRCLSIAQMLGGNLERAAQVRRRGGELAARAIERVQVPPPRAECARHVAGDTCRVLQV